MVLCLSYLQQTLVILASKFLINILPSQMLKFIFKMQLVLDALKKVVFLQ